MTGASVDSIVSVSKAAVRAFLAWLVSPRAALLFGEPFFWLLGQRRMKQKMVLAKISRVLVVKLDEIGDVVLTTPFLRELRRTLPKAWITLVVKPQVHSLVAGCPYVNEVLTYNWNTGGRFPQHLRHWQTLKLGWKHLWWRRFDVAFLPRWAVDRYHGSFVVYFSAARWRIGFSEQVTEQKRRRNRGFDRLLTRVLDDPSLKHEVERNLDLIRLLGGTVRQDRLEIWPDREDTVKVRLALQSYAVHLHDFLVAFGPGAGAMKRQWPLANFVQLGAWLQREYGARIVVVGGPGEEQLAQSLQQQLGDTVIKLVGHMSLPQTGVLLQRCNLYVGNDSAPMHLAAAAGRTAQ